MLVELLLTFFRDNGKANKKKSNYVITQSFENGSINFDLRTGDCMLVKPTPLWKASKDQLQALVNAEQGKKIEEKKSKRK